MAKRYFGGSTAPIVANADDDIHILAGADIILPGAVIDSAFSAANVDVYVAGSVTTTTNSGFRDGFVISLTGGGNNSVAIYDTGQVNGNIWSFGSLASVVNHGNITGNVTFHATTAFVYNTGNITGAVDFINYYATILSNTLTVINSGTIEGSIFCYNADDRIYNSGSILGSVRLGGGNDIFQSFGGSAEFVSGEAGDDQIIGGSETEYLDGGTGANWIVGGGGGDRISLAIDNQIDRVFAGGVNGADGSNDDWLWMYGDGGVNIFLGDGYVTQGVGNQQTLIALIGSGFEHAEAGSGNDYLGGNAADNILNGHGGGDWLVGGLGADTFCFSSMADFAAGDQVADFRRSENDKIDISLIDADVSTFPVNDTFAFRTAHTNNAAREVVVTNYGIGARVDLYTTADNVIDATFYVTFAQPGMTGLQAGDFIL